MQCVTQQVNENILQTFKSKSLKLDVFKTNPKQFHVDVNTKH